MSASIIVKMMPRMSRPSPRERHALRLDDDAVVEEDERAADDERADDVLDELVDLPERLVRAEHAEVERRVEAAAPEHQRAQEEDDEPDEDELVGEPGRL